MAQRRLLPPLHIASVVALAAFVSPFVRGATPDQVDTAIERGQKYLLAQQKPAGHWEGADARQGETKNIPKMMADNYGGNTALATCALLASGVSTNDPKIIAAVEFL